ncbi:glycosyltransferase family 4 protein [Micromonospora sp. Llam7]|uniref:glycosyltransferase family 4 protein n=1 Tax=Micromonospora tarapacensis TaxID=2835305 RepID=UPI001C840039|nr:glycosyltransferase family 4 protein [Micromonospora tarapacensis]MBX7268047.1 glycosyltransferase family 4 protein [Micromonospora tarapacensis]
MKRPSSWIACVGPFLFPWGEAGSRRVYGLVASLAAAGRTVVVAGGGPEPRTETPLPGIDGPGSVSYLGLAERPAPEAGPVRSSVQTLLRWGWRTAQWLDAQPTRPSHVLVHGGQAQYMFHLRRWCERNGVPLIVDVVDWFNGHHVRGGYLGPLHLSMKLALHHYYPRCDGIIAISSYLEAHYRSAGRPLLRVPPTLDVKNLTLDARNSIADSSPLTLVYAGNPHGNKKDLLGTVIEAVGRVEREGAQIELRIYGPTQDEVRRIVDGRPLPGGVRCLSRLPQSDVAAALQEADFTVLVRRPDRATEAGFSTKFCESLASGTPVIANLTSDMGRYLRHNIEGLVCRDHTLDEVVTALRTAARLDGAQRSIMRQAARSRALESFDYRAWAEPVGNFFRQWG